MKTDNPKIKLSSALLGIAIAGLLAFAFVIFSYFMKFGGHQFSTDQSIWGAFGDYVGGLLNPMLSFLTILGLLFTIYLQKESLDNSKKELKLTRKSVDATKEELVNSNKFLQISQQELEATKKAIEQQYKSFHLQIEQSEIKDQKDDLLATIKYLEQYIDHLLDFKVNEHQKTLREKLFHNTGIFSKSSDKSGSKMLFQNILLLDNYVFELNERSKGGHPLLDYICQKIDSILAKLELHDQIETNEFDQLRVFKSSTQHLIQIKLDQQSKDS